MPPYPWGMPAPKKPSTFDEHLGSVVAGLAKPHGGRPFLISLLDWSKGTVDRRVSGAAPFLVRELEIVASALNTTPSAIAEQALRNYANGTERQGLEKLIEVEGAPVVSEPPISLTDHRKSKKPSEMTEQEHEGVPNAANADPEIGHDEQYD